MWYTGLIVGGLANVSNTETNIRSVSYASLNITIVHRSYAILFHLLNS